MAVALQNFKFAYRNAKGKPVFVPTDKTRAIATEIRAAIEERLEFEPLYYHLSKGAHVAALHAHRQHLYFARLDLKNFFYSVGRNRVKSNLKAIGVPSPERYARWSCVKNPYGEPAYALPYGFPQSPLLATLVLRRSALGSAIQSLPTHVQRSVYLDDIAISSNDEEEIGGAFQSLLTAIEIAGFTPNEEKICPPSKAINLFNCDLTHGRTAVCDDRVSAFYSVPTSDESEVGFEGYRSSVEQGNW